LDPSPWFHPPCSALLHSTTPSPSAFCWARESPGQAQGVSQMGSQSGVSTTYTDTLHHLTLPSSQAYSGSSQGHQGRRVHVLSTHEDLCCASHTGKTRTAVANHPQYLLSQFKDNVPPAVALSLEQPTIVVGTWALYKWPLPAHPNLCSWALFRSFGAAAMVQAVEEETCPLFLDPAQRTSLGNTIDWTNISSEGWPSCTPVSPARSLRDVPRCHMHCNIIRTGCRPSRGSEFEKPLLQHLQEGWLFSDQINTIMETFRAQWAMTSP
jgi:hypothetical protein